MAFGVQGLGAVEFQVELGNEAPKCFMVSVEHGSIRDLVSFRGDVIDNRDHGQAVVSLALFSDDSFRSFASKDFLA